jgi:hypothetical protein
MRRIVRPQRHNDTGHETNKDDNCNRQEPSRICEVFVASQSTPSWNQILSFLQQMAQLRESAGSAA